MKFDTRSQDTKLKYSFKNQSAKMQEPMCYLIIGRLARKFKN